MRRLVGLLGVLVVIGGMAAAIAVLSVKLNNSNAAVEQSETQVAQLITDRDEAKAKVVVTTDPNLGTFIIQMGENRVVRLAPPDGTTAIYVLSPDGARFITLENVPEEGFTRSTIRVAPELREYANKAILAWNQGSSLKLEPGSFTDVMLATSRR